MPDPSQPLSLPHVMIVATECKGLAKVGGLADVVGDLSAELTRQGVRVSLVLPGYEQIPVTGPTVSTMRVQFAGASHAISVEEVCKEGFTADLIRCPTFFGGQYGEVYIDSSLRGGGPFEDDAARFAFFSTAVAQLLLEEARYGNVNVLHCHDWHTGTLILLARLTPRLESLRQLPILFTIHNLDYQGQRPLQTGSPPQASSLEGWFPQDYSLLGQPPHLEELQDPIAHNCYNPMRTAIGLADFVSTVSPNYAAEICRPDDADRNFVGGRGLEGLLASRSKSGTLAGLLNGIDYNEFDPQRLEPPFALAVPDWERTKRLHKEKLRLRLLEGELSQPDIAGALQEVHNATSFGKTPLVVAVTRLAKQKVSLLFQEMGTGTLLDALSEIPANFLILGTGEYGPRLHRSLTRNSRNILHIGRFDQNLADLLYAAGEIFLMPSDFEPCGISQMIAMRFGTVPVVAPVGGLADTVQDGINGYHVPIAESRLETAWSLHRTLLQAVEDCMQRPELFRTLQERAMTARFTWQESATGYVRIYQQIRRDPCT